MVFRNSDKTKDNVNIHTATPEARANADALEERDEREVLEHPDQITRDAQAGVQKAEATALVWSRKALYSTYAWYVFQTATNHTLRSNMKSQFAGSGCASLFCPCNTQSATT